MKWFFLVYFLTILVHSQDTPYYNREFKKDQDAGGVEQNFRELTNQGQSNTLRARDSVTGSTTPGDTCIDNPTFCVDATNHCVNMSCANITRLSISSGIAFPDGSFQTTAFTSTGTFAINTSSQAIYTADFSGSNQVFQTCIGTITVTTDGSPYRIIFSGNLANSDSGSTSYGTIFQDGNFISPFSQTVGMMKAKNGTGVSGIDISFNYYLTPSVGTHSWCAAFRASGVGDSWALAGTSRGVVFRVESAR